MLDDNDPRHGTINAYNNLACRCQPCRDAWNDYSKTRRWKAGKGPLHGPKLPRTPRHGTRFEYVKHKCRCILCRQAEAAYRKNYRRQKAKKAAKNQ